MKNEECKHLKNIDDNIKHPFAKDEYESTHNRLICGICNCYMDYKKKLKEGFKFKEIRGKY